VAAVLLIGALVAALHAAGLRVCLFRRLTGWPCLTCGSTRAVAALAAGHVREALALQPLAVVGGAAAALAFAAYTWCLFVARRALSVRVGARTGLALAAALALLAALNWAYLVSRGV
jgi:hypothetical protein